MTFTEAVKLAQQKDQRGQGYLYQTTYAKALQRARFYMNNEADAEDIVQQAYIKAFDKLYQIEDPEKFPQWLGKIVANTAKNELKRKNMYSLMT